MRWFLKLPQLLNWREIPGNGWGRNYSEPDDLPELGFGYGSLEKSKQLEFIRDGVREEKASQRSGDIFQSCRESTISFQLSTDQFMWVRKLPNGLENLPRQDRG